MNGRIVVRIVLALLVMAALVGLGVTVYNAGVAQGLAASGKLVVPEGGVAPPSALYYPPFYRPWGFGLGCLGLIFPLLFVLLILSAMRGLFFAGWRHRGGWGGPPGEWPKGVPPRVEEWHRKLHESPSGDKPAV
jgi:hypothetical protein